MLYARLMLDFFSYSIETLLKHSTTIERLLIPTTTFYSVVLFYMSLNSHITTDLNLSHCYKTINDINSHEMLLDWRSDLFNSFLSSDYWFMCVVINESSFQCDIVCIKLARCMPVLMKFRVCILSQNGEPTECAAGYECPLGSKYESACTPGNYQSSPRRKNFNLR